MARVLMVEMDSQALSSKEGTKGNLLLDALLSGMFTVKDYKLIKTIIYMYIFYSRIHQNIM